MIQQGMITEKDIERAEKNARPANLTVLEATQHQGKHPDITMCNKVFQYRHSKGATLIDVETMVVSVETVRAEKSFQRCNTIQSY